LGYGRIIPNYDNTGTGNLSGTGSGNAPGNYMLIAGNGTFTKLAQIYQSSTGTWKHLSDDGTFVLFDKVTGKLRYPDGVVVTYTLTNNRVLPTSIQSLNGNVITIAYKTYNSTTFPMRWAIDTIQDTLGRYVRFYYDSNAQLTSVTAPGFNGGSDRTLVQFQYQDITLSYTFDTSVFAVNAPSSGSTIAVLRRIYFPATGTGYLFTDYSSYGMIRRVSQRNQMTGSGGSVTDGTEIAYTDYNFPATTTESGVLSNVPGWTERKDYWQGKTDDAGSPSSSPTIYSYSKSNSGGTSKYTEIHPTSTQNPDVRYVVKTVDNSTSSSTYALILSEAEYMNSTSNPPVRISTFAYTTPSDGGIQLASITVKNEAGQESKTTFDYGSWGRLDDHKDYGFSSGGVFSLYRTTHYAYLNTTSYPAFLPRLQTEVSVLDGSGVTKAKRTFTYDTYTTTLKTYGSSPPAQTRNSAFDSTSYTLRGNVTRVTNWKDVGAGTTIIRDRQWDIFGNVVQQDVNCCDVKNTMFGSSTYFSLPDSVTDGTSGVSPYLTTSYQYDFNSSVTTQMTGPDGAVTSYGYDSAMRPYQTTQPTVSGVAATVVTTSPGKDAYGNDLPVEYVQTSYTEAGGSNKVVMSKVWFDGHGQAIRRGKGSGSSPTSYDAVQTVYDSFGRILKRSNPYAGGSDGIGSPSYWTVYHYDIGGRVIQVTAPDTSATQTDYSGGATVVDTDQVGRKKQTTVDGFGRLASVVEQNPSTGLLDATNYLTSYSYDVLDDVVQITQGAQTRNFTFDALGRMTARTTPEGGTEGYTYTDFDTPLKHTDARGVETHYQYDTLNRIKKVWYTGTGGSDDPTGSRPGLPTGVAALQDVDTTYVASGNGNGNVSAVTDYLDGSTPRGESYSYDAVGRVTSRTRYIDSTSYPVSYTYNGMSQVSVVTYPSGKQVRQQYDALGRLNNVDKVNTPTATYLTVSSGGYDVAWHLTQDTLGNGLTETWAYSSDRMQETGQTVANGGATLLTLTNGYSAVSGGMGTGTSAGNTGLLVSVSGSINSTSQSQAFTYDTMRRLVTATQSGVWARRYDYDRWGNRTGVWNATSGGTQIQSVTMVDANSDGVPDTNRVASVTAGGVTTNYAYNAAGGLTTDGNAYTYDAANRVATGGAATYTYDHENHRTKKASGGTTTRYIWDGDRVIAEYDGTGSLLGEYVYAGRRLVLRDVSGTLNYYHKDTLSVRMITDGSGTVVGTQAHYPFGDDAGTSGTATTKSRFTSYERDPETSTDYAVNRQFLYATGRFNRPDPMPGSSYHPTSYNRYAYVENDPVNATDPLGLAMPCDPFEPSDPGFERGIDFVSLDVYVGTARVRTAFFVGGNQAQVRLPRSVCYADQEADVIAYYGVSDPREMTIDNTGADTKLRPSLGSGEAGGMELLRKSWARPTTTTGIAYASIHVLSGFHTTPGATLEYTTGYREPRSPFPGQRYKDGADVKLTCSRTEGPMFDAFLN
ncbi:MAG: RHS repeat-associated core domain-containing protein, partial [Blastocatellia bacterium]